DQLRERARASLQEHGGGVDETAFAKLVKQLRYVDGDYADASTFTDLRRQLDGAVRPAHYLAIPPSLFGVVVEGLGKSGCAARARAGWPARAAAGAPPRPPAHPTSLSPASARGRGSPEPPTPREGGRPTPSSSPPPQPPPSPQSETAATSRACRSRWPRSSAS